MKQNNNVAMRFAKTALILAAVAYAGMYLCVWNVILGSIVCYTAVPTAIVFAFLAKFKSLPHSRARKHAAIAMAIHLPLLFVSLFSALQAVFGALGYTTIKIAGTVMIDSLAVCIFLGVSYVRGRFF